ncbi:MAG: peptidylprolyl isomerase [Candidatus Acidiferrum sp.]|jgi:peptidyl-prolyl cis-trans isomerase A (cyclophilin A)
MIKATAMFLAATLALATLAAGQTPSQTPDAGASKPTVHKSAAPAPAVHYDRALLHPALLKAQAPATYQVKFTTTKGDFTLTVTRAWAPIGADRFYNLVKHHFYDNASFFRVLSNPPFMAQFGLSAYPAVSAAWSKANLTDDPVAQSNLRGYVSFATAGANTRTTQVFINYGDNKRLDGMGFAPFGQVSDGMSVVDSLYGDYGEGAPQGGGPDQEQIEKQGKPYLDKGWPKLDYIKTAGIIGEPAAPAKKPVAKPAAAKPANQ